MTNQHPITPPPELVEKWVAATQSNDCIGAYPANYEQLICIAAARWGADQELDACCEWMLANARFLNPSWIKKLRASRRPEPPNLKARAMSEVASAMARGNITPERGAIIRLALEQLDD